MKKKLFYLVTEDWFFCSHFIERAIAAKEEGYDVTVLAKENSHAEKIRAAGLNFIGLRFERRSINLVRELGLLLKIIKIYRRELPHIVHHVAAKPILYGSISGLLCGRHRPAIVNAPVGMGYVFSSDDRLARMLKPLVRLAFRWLLCPDSRSRVIFENPDDQRNFIANRTVSEQQALVIPGAGVDTEIFHPVAEPAMPVVVSLVARMLKDKGVLEFVEAARILHSRGVEARMVLVGGPDQVNPASLSEAQLSALHGRFGVEWWGWRECIADVLRQSHIACLPSYREGLPKALIEAASSGLPIVTTDAVGCREVVCPDINGLLVPIKEPIALANALERLIVDPRIRARMGGNSRQLAIEKFSSDKIIKSTLQVYRDMLIGKNEGCL